MFNLDKIFNIKKTLMEKIGKIKAQVGIREKFMSGEDIVELITGISFVLFDIIVSIGFIWFSLIYINQINPIINVNYKFLFLILIYWLLISNSTNVLIDIMGSIYVIFA